MKKFLSFLILMLMVVCVGCSNGGNEVDENGITMLKFKNTNSNETIRKLDGKQVSITGYISTLSPLNGEFAYLMNLPYQNCPFCIPGTAEITNTLAIYSGNNSKIAFTDEPVTVIGTLEVGNFTDEFGYEYGVRLNNVTVNKADMDKLSESVRLYNTLAENGMVDAIYGSIMVAEEAIYYDYYELEKPELIELDVIKSTKNNLGNYNSNGEYDNLVSIMTDLVALSEKANLDITNKDYSKFKDYQTELDKLFYAFSDWMAEGEL